MEKEQLERYRATFKCLELARAEKKFDEDELITVACEYGRGISLTEDECKIVLDMKVRDVINLEI
jgi:hypothetical protein